MGAGTPSVALIDLIVADTVLRRAIVIGDTGMAAGLGGIQERFADCRALLHLANVQPICAQLS